MAQLKDTTIQGSARVTDTLYANAIQAKIFNAPTASGGTAYGAGSSGQALLSNGTTAYWGTISGTVSNGTNNYLLVGKGTSTVPAWTSPKDALNMMINQLDTGSSNLTANDYVITQYVNGGTTTTTYHRRPASAMRVGGLLTARKLKVALGSTAEASFDGTADQTSIPISGTLGAGYGGTGQTQYTTGDILYASAATTLSKLTGNTTTTVKYLKSVATTSGTAVAPVWAQIAASEISGLGAAATKAVTDNSSNADVTSTDTNLITGRTLYYQLAKKGYTTNTGTVTSVTLTSGSGITVSDSGTAITGSGSRTISITGMNTTSGSTSKCLTEKGTWASFSNNSGTVTSVTLTSGAGITVSDSGTAITGSGSRTISITGVDTSSGSTTQCLTKKGTWASFTNNAGTVTSVQVAASDPLQSSTGTASSTTLSTTISFINQDPNTVLAGPSSGSSAAAPTFRALVAADIPSLSWNKITSDKPTTLSGYGITDGVSSSALESYLPLGGGTMTGTITLNNGVAINTSSDAGWSMNQYGNFTHRRSNANDYLGVVGSNGDFRVYYDSGNVTTNGYINASNGVYATNGTLVSRAATPQLHFQNASAQDIGGMYASSNRVYIRERPFAGSSYVTDIVFPTAKSNGNENVYVYTSRNFSLSGTTLTITVPS